MELGTQKIEEELKDIHLKRKVMLECDVDTT